ncbi:MAG: Clp protease N-terminal domain-containing protein [Acidimicrobiia bacterium]
MYRATREARPQSASPGHLLLALVAGNGPACEILTEAGVDLQALAAALRRSVDGGTARETASSCVERPPPRRTALTPAAVSR